MLAVFSRYFDQRHCSQQRSLIKYAKVHAIVRSDNVQEALLNMFREIPSVRNSNKSPIAEKFQQDPVAHQLKIQLDSSTQSPSPLQDMCQQSPVTQLAQRGPAHSDVHTILAALQQRHLMQRACTIPRCYTCGLSDHMTKECPEKNKNVCQHSM
jgi:hypothetical protein